jgi:hypothetical protein
VTETFQKARELGLTVLRMWAFADGPTEWNALQPRLGEIDEFVAWCGSEPLFILCSEGAADARNAARKENRTE